MHANPKGRIKPQKVAPPSDLRERSRHVDEIQCSDFVLASEEELSPGMLTGNDRKDFLGAYRRMSQEVQNYVSQMPKPTSGAAALEVAFQ